MSDTRSKQFDAETGGDPRGVLAMGGLVEAQMSRGDRAARRRR